MADVLTREQRRLNMSRIRGRNTKPETRLRSALHAQGLRFRLHRRDLPGSPDIVFVAPKVAIFVDGCFWHGCPEHGVKPRTNGRFWSDKIKGNQERDRKATKKLRALGWRVVRIWEHELKKDISGVVSSIQHVTQQRDREPPGT